MIEKTCHAADRLPNTVSSLTSPVNKPTEHNKINSIDTVEVTSTTPAIRAKHLPMTAPPVSTVALSLRTQNSIHFTPPARDTHEYTPDLNQPISEHACTTSSSLAPQYNLFKAVSAYPRTLGVAVDYGTHWPLSQLVNCALSLVSQAGFRLPDRIKLDSNHFKGRGEDFLRSTAGEFKIYGLSNGYSEETAIILNPEYHWETPNTKGSTRHLLHPILHELGHAAHYYEDPIAFILKCFDEVPENISRLVSPYSGKHIKEFVAEVFVLKVLRHEVPRTVDALYHHHRGPVAQGNASSNCHFYRPPPMPTPQWPDHQFY